MPDSAPTSAASDEYSIGTVIVLHHPSNAAVSHPGSTWFRIQRGWINAFGSEVALPWSGSQESSYNAVTVVHRPEDTDPDAH